jgi:hypothetical protein
VEDEERDFLKRLTPGYLEQLTRGIADFADFGVTAGLAAYCILELRSTGNFGLQPSSYATAAETQAGVILGIAAGFAAAAFFMLLPIGRVFGTSRPAKTDEVPPAPIDVVSVGLGGREPSPRPLTPLIRAELRGYAMAAFGFATLVVALYVPISRSLPSALPFVVPAGLLGLLLYLWSRVARLQRLCRTGTEVEGRLVGVDVGDDRQMLARYEYSFRGRTRRVTNNSWLGRRSALRYGERIIVLLDPLEPQDAVILGRLPNT